MVVMGRVVAPYGVYGWLKVIPDTEQMDGLFDYEHWWLGKGDDWREMTIETAKIHNDVLVVKLAGVDDRDAAFALKGKQVAVPRAMLPAPPENEYYWSDLIGLQVKNTQDVDLGEIVDVFETGANDVIVVRPQAVKTTANALVEKVKVEDKLLPFIASVVLEVDLENKSVLVDWDADF
jgi:16S rRNA processing protein RimM